MKKILLAVTILMCIIQSCKTTQTNPEKSPPVEFELNDSIINIINLKMEEYPIGTELSIALMKKDSVAYFGASRKNDKIERLQNRNTIFEIGSISKVFTSHLLVNAVLRKEIQLNDPISEYLEFEMKNNKNITFQQLSTHTAGLPVMPQSFFDNLVDTINPYKDYTEEKLLYDLKNEIEIDTQSIGKFQYSNFGVSLLGYLLAKHKNSTYEALLQKEILKPLSMRQTTTKRNNLKNRLATAMLFNGNVVSNWDLNALSPAGGVLSSSEDLAKYAMHCYSDTNQTFPVQSELQLQKTKKSAQALGWMIVNSKTGEPHYFHAGETGGYSCLIVLRPDTKKAVVILSNIAEANNSVEMLGFKLMKELNNLE